MGPEPTILDH